MKTWAERETEVAIKVLTNAANKVGEMEVTDPLHRAGADIWLRGLALHQQSILDNHRARVAAALAEYEAEAER